MKFAALMSCTAVAALLAQTTVLASAPLRGFAPDLSLLLCVYLGLRAPSPGGALGAFAVGYLQDAFSGNVLGLHAFALSAVFLSVYFAARQLWVENPLSQVFLFFVASVEKSLLVLLLTGLFLSAVAGAASLLTLALWQAVLAALFGPPLLFLLGRLFPDLPEEEA
ncbi:MAG: hypothetical protein KatS3mg076_3099 [Candidatus Binatia bacterium]|nr:MAG: hypothetical protein KatS3mg076_3099 [Candidatus Binatia bacterium]